MEDFQDRKLCDNFIHLKNPTLAIKMLGGSFTEFTTEVRVDVSEVEVDQDVITFLGDSFKSVAEKINPSCASFGDSRISIRKFVISDFICRLAKKKNRSSNIQNMKPFK